MMARNPVKTLRKAAASALLASLILAGCGGETPESMLASAREYLAKNDRKAAVIQLKNALQADTTLAEARFLLGRALLEDGDPALAEVELRKALDYKHPAGQVVPLLAQALLQNGQAKKLVEEFARTTLETPEAQAELQVALGQAHLLQGANPAADAAFRAALTARPGHPQALLGQIRLKALAGDAKGALASLDDVLAQHPGLHDGWQLKGDLLYAQRDVDGSLAAYRKALEAKPDFLPVHALLIARLLDGNRLEDAARQQAELRKLAPKHPQTLYLQSFLDFRQKNYKPAREGILEYLRILPESALGLQLAGMIEYDLKSYPQAEAYLLKALARAPELGLARRTLIATYLRSGQPAKAAAQLRPVLDRIEGNSNLLALAGEVFMQNGELERAGEYFAKATALDPQNAGKRTSLAVVNLARGDSETAFRQLGEVAAVDTGINADLAMIAAHLRRGEMDAALKAIDGLEKKQPDSPLVHNLRGNALLGKRDAAGARASFERALALDAAYFPAAANLASLDFAEKKPEAARKRFEAVLAKDPKSVPAYVALAEFLARTGGKTEEIATVLGKAIAAGPDEPAPRVALVALYLRAKDQKKALAAAQEAQAAHPDRPEIVDALGRAQQAAGDTNQALGTYGRLATLLPGSPQPHLRMAEIHAEAKNREAARASLRKALEIRTDLVEAQRGLLLLELEGGRVPEALAIARQVQKQRPREAVGFALEGDVHASRRNWNEAIAAYRAGLRQSSAPELAIRMHAAQLAAGARAEAERFAEGWLRDHPKDVPFRVYLAEAANERKDYAQSTRLYRALLDGQPENPTLLNNLAWTTSQLKDPKAVEYAEKANRLAPGQPLFMDTLGVILVERGDIVRGLELLRQAVGLAPQQHVIRLNYARALIKAGKSAEARKELAELARLGDGFPAQAEVERLMKGL